MSPASPWRFFGDEASRPKDLSEYCARSKIPTLSEGFLHFPGNPFRFICLHTLGATQKAKQLVFIALRALEGKIGGGYGSVATHGCVLIVRLRIALPLTPLSSAVSARRGVRILSERREPKDLAS